MTNNKGHTAIEHVKMVKKSEQEHYVRKFKRMGTKMDDQFMTKLSRFLPKRDSVISLLEDYELTNDEF